MKAALILKLSLLVPFSQAETALRKVAMPKFDDPFLSYYERERASLLQQLEGLQSGKWRVLNHAVDITSECIESTEKKIGELDALADELARAPLLDLGPR